MNIVRWTLLLLACACRAQDLPVKTKEVVKVEKEDDDSEEDATQQLAKVRRVFVDLLSGGEAAIRLRDLLMSSLQAAHLFILTEDEDKADAVLKGSGHDEVFTDRFSSSENLNAHSNVGTNRNSTSTGSNIARGALALGMGVGESESQHSEERKHEALATLRLVNKDGDVIWSTTQESLGGKFLGASADVADKVAKRLSADVKKARREAAK